MKRILLTLSLTLLPTLAMSQQSCPTFTPEQQYLLRVAHVYGNQPNPRLEAAIGDRIGYTMAAMLWKESFVEDRIFRHNPADPSYGVMMVTFTAYLRTKGWNREYMSYNIIHEHSNGIAKMIENDVYAIQVGYDYLTIKMIEQRSLWEGVRTYNGSNQTARDYRDDVRERVSTLIRCSNKIF
jgi:hypothetical protein